MAEITFKCPGCKRFLRASAQSAAANCPHCGTKVAIGQPSAPDDPFAGLEGDSDNGPAEDEPWYYKFLSGYAAVVMWLAIMIVVLGGIVLIGVVLTSGQQFPVAIISMVGIVVSLVFCLVGILVCVALILLAVDIGRSLRAIRKNTRR